MKRNRERTEIIHDILAVIREKGGTAKPTHILYKSNLSHKMLKEYLMELIENGFLSENAEKGAKIYKLETKGFNYLKDFSMIRSFMDSYGLG